MTSWRDEYGGPALIDKPLHGLDNFADAVCHRFNGDAPRAACGVPRSEQPAHGGSQPTYAVRAQSHCPWCGHRLCGQCLERIR